MSLSARIAVEPSRRMASAAAFVSVTGVLVAARTVLERWPTSTAWTVAAATVAAIVLVASVAGRHRGSGRRVLMVSHRAEVDVVAGDAFDGSSWRLTDGTLRWAGFSMLALRREEPRETLRLPVFDAELPTADRRALGRFLLWSLRGGARAATAPRADGGPR